MEVQINNHAAVSDLLLNYKQLSDEYLSGKIANIQENYKMWNEYFSVINTLIAIDKKDELLVNFTADSTSNLERLKAEKVKNIAMIDSDKMRYKKTRIQANLESYFCGLAVRYNNRWDGYHKCPEFIVVTPTQLILDPRGGKNIKNHRFIGFKTLYRRNDMQGEEWIEKNVKEALKELDGGDEEQKQDRERRNIDFGYQSETERKIQMMEGKINVCDFFCRIQDGKDKKTYFITITQSNGQILRIKEIEPVTEEEKMYPEKIRFPVVFTRYAETIGADPIGKSVFDLLHDKQRTKSDILNRMEGMIRKNTGDVDLSDIDTSSDKVIAIPEDAKNAQVPAGNDLRSMIEMKNQTDKEIEKLVAVNDSKRIQNQIESEIDFWKVWLECYIRNYKGGKSYITEKKGIRSQKKIDKSDFQNNILKIEIRSKLLDERMNREKRMNLLSVQGTLQGVHAENKIAGKTFARELLRLGGTSEEDVMAFVPMDGIEIIIERENDMLKQDRYIKLQDTDDPLSRVSSQMDIDTPAGLKRRVELTMAIKKLDSERAEQERIQKQM